MAGIADFSTSLRGACPERSRRGWMAMCFTGYRESCTPGLAVEAWDRANPTETRMAVSLYYGLGRRRGRSAPHRKVEDISR
jgi:hypothetical protein